AGKLTAPSGATSTVTASKSAGFVLTDTSLSASDGLNLTLSNINQANLTATTTQGGPTDFVDATGFQGTTTLVIKGTGNAVVLGGKGPNTITDSGTGNNFNILIGGGGQSIVTGNGNDVLISGTTDYAGNVAALNAILGVWSNKNMSYADRIHQLNGTNSGPKFKFLLNSTSVHSNGKVNTLTDSVTQPHDTNWFIAFAGDTVSAKQGETTDRLS